MLIAAALAPAIAAADMRGQAVCGVPANERITLTAQAADEKWWACGSEDCPRGPINSETLALAFSSYSAQSTLMSAK